MKGQRAGGPLRALKQSNRKGPKPWKPPGSPPDKSSGIQEDGERKMGGQVVKEKGANSRP